MTTHMGGRDGARTPARAPEPGAGVGLREGGEPEGYPEWTVSRERFLASDLGKAFSDFRGMRKHFERVRVRIYPITSRICIALLTATGQVLGRSCADIVDFDWVLASVREMVEA
jgi:hypothetical protein